MILHTNEAKLYSWWRHLQLIVIEILNMEKLQTDNDINNYNNNIRACNYYIIIIVVH